MYQLLKIHFLFLFFLKTPPLFHRVESPVGAVCVCSLSRTWLCDPMDCGPPGFSVHGISQAKILEWVAISSSRGSSWPRDGICLLHLLHGQADSLPTALPRKWVQTRSQSSPALFQPRGGSMPQLVDFLSWDWVEISDPDEPCWWSPFQRGSWYTGLLCCPTLALIHSGPSLPECGLQFFLWSWDPPMSAPKVIASP